MPARKTVSKANFFENIVSSASKVHLLILIVAFVIFGWIAVDNVANESAYRIALIYVVLLIAAMFIILFDYLSGTKKEFPLEAKLWDSKSLRKNILFGLIFFIAWYLFFMKPGFTVAVPQAFASLQAGPIINTSMQVILGPMAENILFFGALAFTFMALIRWVGDDKKASYALAIIVFLSQFIFIKVPYHNVTVTVAAVLIAVMPHTKSPAAKKYLPVLASALFVGANVFPQFHSFAYALVEKNFYAAVFFGFLMVLTAVLVGLFAVEIIHALNNFVAIVA